MGCFGHVPGDPFLHSLCTGDGKHWRRETLKNRYTESIFQSSSHPGSICDTAEAGREENRKTIPAANCSFLRCHRSSSHSHLLLQDGNAIFLPSKGETHTPPLWNLGRLMTASPKRECFHCVLEPYTRTPMLPPWVPCWRGLENQEHQSTPQLKPN